MSSASASSSHEPPRSYYPTARPRPDSPATTAPNTAASSQQKPLDDGRELRRSQRERKPPVTQQQPLPAATPLAQLLQDGRTLRRGARERESKTTTTTTTQTERPEHNTTSTTTTTTTIPTTDDAEPDAQDAQSLMQTGKHTSTPNKQPTRGTRIDDTAPTLNTAATEVQSPTTPNPTPPDEGRPTGNGGNSSDVELVHTTRAATRTATHSLSTHPATDAAPHAQAQASSSSNPRRSSSSGRTWDRVEQALVDIRRMAQAFEDSQGHGEGIANAADAALVDLLVDTPTALQLETQPMPGDPTANNSPAAAATHAAQQLRSMARTLLSRSGDSLLPCAMVAPHVSAIIRWLETLDQGNVAVHVQLPPVLTLLREILDLLLREQPGGTSIWARMVAVADALENLIAGNSLAHPADVLAIQEGGVDTALMCADVPVPEWYQAVETLRRLLSEVCRWPAHMLPTIQEAATNLVSESPRLPLKPRDLARGHGRLKPGGTKNGTMGWGTQPEVSPSGGEPVDPEALRRRTACQMEATDAGELWRNMPTTMTSERTRGARGTENLRRAPLKASECGQCVRGSFA